MGGAVPVDTQPRAQAWMERAARPTLKREKALHACFVECDAVMAHQMLEGLCKLFCEYACFLMWLSHGC